MLPKRTLSGHFFDLIIQIIPSYYPLAFHREVNENWWFSFLFRVLSLKFFTFRGTGLIFIEICIKLAYNVEALPCFREQLDAVKTISSTILG